MNRVECFSTVNTTASKNRKIEYIVVHYTAGTTSKSGTAKSTAKYFAKETVKASADYIIDDNNIVQFNGDIKNRYTWHCGGNKYKTLGGSLYKICTSANSIGIEVCSTNKTGKVTVANDENWYFTDAVIENLIVLVKELMNEYNIPVENVIRHYDVNGKPCPGIYGWNEDTGETSLWQAFKDNLIEKPIIEEKRSNEEIETIVKEVVEQIDKNDDFQFVEPKVEKNEEPQHSADPIVKKSLLETFIDFIMGLFSKK